MIINEIKEILKFYQNEIILIYVTKIYSNHAKSPFFFIFFVALTKYTQYYEVEDNPLFDEREYDKQTTSRNCKLSRNNKRNV